MASVLSNLRLTQIGPALKIVFDAFVHRTELAGLEIGEAANRVLISALCGVVAALFVLFTGTAITFAIAAAVWDRPDRVMILGLVSLGYIVIAGVVAWIGYRRLKAWHPLEETRRQLTHDRVCLETLFSSESSTQ